MTATALMAVILGMVAMYFGLSLGRRGGSVIRTGTLTICIVKGGGGTPWIRTPDGRFLVFGAGMKAQPLLDSLKKRGAKTVELLVLPTSEPEQIGGAAALIDTLPITSIVESGIPPFDKPAANDAQYQVRLRLTRKRIPVIVARAGETLNVGAVRVEILAPLPPKFVPSPRFVRDDALVVRVVYGKTAFLFCGGLTKRGETGLLSRAPRLKSDGLFLPTGFGIETASPEFLRLVSPEQCVIGANTASFGKGWEERLRATGAKIYLTGSAPGEILFQSDGTVITSH